MRTEGARAPEAVNHDTNELEEPGYTTSSFQKSSSG